MKINDSLLNEFSKFISHDRLLSDDLSLSAVSTDASFYQLKPQLIIDVLNTDEVKKIFRLSAQFNIGITLRAAGTSLSGQSQGNGILLRVTKGFKEIKVLDGGEKISLSSGVIGSHANRSLKKYFRKIGPDPASINSCMIGGIAANNASGMCCGTDQNTYKTLSSMKLILAPRDINPNSLIPALDTSDPKSIEHFKLNFPEIITELKNIRESVLLNKTLKKLIEEKYKIKNTMGYALNSIIDFSDPIDILQHLMIGSEGTLGFISEITYNTVPDFQHKACALVYFHSLYDACEAASILRGCPIAACELMDRTSLKSVEDKPSMPEILKTLPNDACALLIEIRSSDDIQLEQDIKLTSSALEKLNLLTPANFSKDLNVIDSWWNIRRGLFPAVGKGRPPGTTVIIEDVAFKGEEFANAAVELSEMLKKNGYEKAILFGHVLDGNLHFSFAQDFSNQQSIDRYEKMMSDLGNLVANKYQGSLKAEHGTGRNMAPFVKQEWGEDAYLIMLRIKNLLDPLYLLNPGVLINEDPKIHLKDIKINPLVDPLIDECIECGFCEVNCPSKDLTLTPRQRIAAFRSLNKIKSRDIHHHFEKDLQYAVNETCATDGMCSTSCPVSIDTGLYIKKYRSQNIIDKNEFLAMIIARNFNLTLSLIKLSLLAFSMLPKFFLIQISKIKELAVFKWTPTPAKKLKHQNNFTQKDSTVIYIPSCISRTMGPARLDIDTQSLPEVHLSVLKEAGFNILIPTNISKLCCGLPFESKGFIKAANYKLSELENEILTLSENGKYPIISDTSPCTGRMLKKIKSRLKIYDSLQFIDQFILTDKNPKLKISKQQTPITVHLTCSSRHMGLNNSITRVAQKCSSEVIIPDDVGCCGFAGDKGFSNPELNDQALSHLKIQVEEKCHTGFSNSRTCEIGLSKNTNLPYKSLIYEVDRLKEKQK